MYIYIYMHICVRIVSHLNPFTCLFQVTEFCTESGNETYETLVHNPVPTNAQNTNCEARSVWEVGD